MWESYHITWYLIVIARIEYFRNNRATHPENTLDKQLAATTLLYELTVVSRSHKDFVKTGVRVLSPFP